MKIQVQAKAVQAIWFTDIGEKQEGWLPKGTYRNKGVVILPQYQIRATKLVGSYGFEYFVQVGVSVQKGVTVVA